MHIKVKHHRIIQVKLYHDCSEFSNVPIDSSYSELLQI